MDNNQAPSFEIPKTAENPPVYSGGQELDPGLTIEGTREILPAPVLPQTQTSGQLSPIGIAHPQQVSGSTLLPQQTALATDDSHIIADDIDVMEKEWVDRAKKIISLTSDDPYSEAKELTKLKATYMKKRFNKDLPVDNEVK